eukprot:m.170052 g.170052  ORF g.170052 m.170052 type:complete len:478 (+) comp16484_c2_seq1:36-1469(+)
MSMPKMDEDGFLSIPSSEQYGAVYRTVSEQLDFDPSGYSQMPFLWSDRDVLGSNAHGQFPTDKNSLVYAHGVGQDTCDKFPIDVNGILNLSLILADGSDVSDASSAALDSDSDDVDMLDAQQMAELEHDLFGSDNAHATQLQGSSPQLPQNMTLEDLWQLQALLQQPLQDDDTTADDVDAAFTDFHLGEGFIQTVAVPQGQEQHDDDDAVVIDLPDFQLDDGFSQTVAVPQSKEQEFVASNEVAHVQGLSPPVDEDPDRSPWMVSHVEASQQLPFLNAEALCKLETVHDGTPRRVSAMASNVCGHSASCSSSLSLSRIADEDDDHDTESLPSVDLPRTEPTRTLERFMAKHGRRVQLSQLMPLISKDPEAPLTRGKSFFLESALCTDKPTYKMIWKKLPHKLCVKFKKERRTLQNRLSQRQRQARQVESNLSRTEQISIHRNQVLEKLRLVRSLGIPLPSFLQALLRELEIFPFETL